MTWTKELDEAAVLATRSGYWHVVLFYLLCGLAAIPTSFLVFSQVFTNATPEHWCAPPPELQHLGLPESLLRSLTIPRQQEKTESCIAYDIDSRELRQALMEYVEESTVGVKEDIIRPVQIYQLRTYDNDVIKQELINNITKAVLTLRQNTTSSCKNGWIYNKEQYRRTLVTQFSLVCDKDWLPRTANTLFWVGSIFGNLFFGWMSDRYGRRTTILLMIVFEVPLPIAAAFATSYWTYVGLCVAGGLFFPAMYQQPFILALELMPPGQRNYTGIVVGMLFATGMCLLSLLAYAVKDSYHLSLVTSLPFILLYGYYWLIPESPRWLVSRGRIADAEKVYRNLAKKNDIHLPRGFFVGITCGAVEIPSYFIAWRCMERFGRRWVLCVFMCVGGLACISCVLVPESWPWIMVSLSMFGRLFAASSFAVFYVLIGELLPTVLRAQAMGAASFIAGLGLLACPYIVHLAVYSRALPLTIMGVFMVLGGITSLFLPETLNQPLPQNLEDGEMFGRDFKILSCVEKQSN